LISAFADDIDPQRSATCGNCEQAIDVRVGAGAIARIFGVFPEHGQAMGGRSRVQLAEDFPEIGVNGQRALLAGCVLDRCGLCPRWTAIAAGSA